MQFEIHTKRDVSLALRPEVQVKFRKLKRHTSQCRKWRFSLAWMLWLTGGSSWLLLPPFSTALATNSVLDSMLTWAQDLITFPIKSPWRISRPSRSVKKMKLSRSQSRIIALLPVAPQTHGVIILTVKTGTAGIFPTWQKRGPRRGPALSPNEYEWWCLNMNQIWELN